MAVHLTRSEVRSLEQDDELNRRGDENDDATGEGKEQQHASTHRASLAALKALALASYGSSDSTGIA